MSFTAVFNGVYPFLVMHHPGQHSPGLGRYPIEWPGWSRGGAETAWHLRFGSQREPGEAVSAAGADAILHLIG